jgi:Zn-finger nucleic acid-binding protein
MEVGTGIVGSAFLTIKITKELIMPKPVTRGTYNNCSECNIKMKDVAFARSVAKLCPDCRGDIASNNIEVRKIYKQLKQRNAGIEDNDDWSTQDDPRAKTEQLYGKVSKVSTKSAYAPVSTLDEMI